jgi:hypothetical protein
MGEDRAGYWTGVLYAHHGNASEKKTRINAALKFLFITCTSWEVGGRFETILNLH